MNTPDSHSPGIRVAKTDALSALASELKSLVSEAERLEARLSGLRRLSGSVIAAVEAARALRQETQDKQEEREEPAAGKPRIRTFDSLEEWERYVSGLDNRGRVYDDDGDDDDGDADDDDDGDAGLSALERALGRMFLGLDGLDGLDGLSVRITGGVR